MLQERRDLLVGEVLLGDGQEARDSKPLLAFPVADGNLHKGRLALEKAVRQQAEFLLVALEEDGTQEHCLTFHGLLLLLQEELEMVSDSLHGYTLQFALSLHNLANFPREPGQVDDHDHSQTHPPQQPEESPPHSAGPREEFPSRVHPGSPSRVIPPGDPPALRRRAEW